MTDHSSMGKCHHMLVIWNSLKTLVNLSVSPGVMAIMRRKRRRSKSESEVCEEGEAVFPTDCVSRICLVLPHQRPAAQCLKCRIPVNTIATSCALAAAMTSSSRIEPPG